MTRDELARWTSAVVLVVCLLLWKELTLWLARRDNPVLYREEHIYKVLLLRRLFFLLFGPLVFVGILFSGCVAEDSKLFVLGIIVVFLGVFVHFQSIRIRLTDGNIEYRSLLGRTSIRIDPRCTVIDKPRALRYVINGPGDKERIPVSYYVRGHEALWRRIKAAGAQMDESDR
jgi:hypothetical protein